jgi:ZIP family zinc transporter
VFAFRYRRYLQATMAFSAGLLIGVVFLHLVPEIIEHAHEANLEPRALMVVLLGGFVAIFLLEKLTIIHSEKTHDSPGHHHHVGLAGAVGLSFLLARRNSRWRTISLLVVNAIAPVAGAMLATVIDIDPRVLAFLLAFMAGFLLYLGASDLLPHVHEQPRVTLILSTVCGLAAAAAGVFALASMHAH